MVDEGLRAARRATEQRLTALCTVHDDLGHFGPLRRLLDAVGHVDEHLRRALHLLATKVLLGAWLAKQLEATKRYERCLVVPRTRRVVAHRLLSERGLRVRHPVAPARLNKRLELHVELVGHGQLGDAPLEAFEQRLEARDAAEA
jgi:hypothetical protein